MAEVARFAMNYNILLQSIWHAFFGSFSNTFFLSKFRKKSNTINIMQNLYFKNVNKEIIIVITS